MFERTKLFLRQNTAQLAIVGIMIAVSVVTVGSLDIETIAKRGR